ncbi:F-box domain-containing protein [Mycena sanguinolenta]|uniref:F-box domain-containing protein n=1 Tax=Mycena sanguinolenta TaxID=230812 RepID=A0A8H6YT93_9AGAR|nr:F-box domain-containing protein [Mycena sanguinolenta]
MASRPIQIIASRTPTAEEIAQRTAERTQIEQLDAQILDLENSLQTLRNARNSLQQKLDDYTYPILTLPPEIVADIFGHYLLPYPLCSRAFGPRSPTTLSRICHSWREIALSTPTLWRAISLYISSSTDLPKRLECLQSWLALSRSCPLSIRLEGQIFSQPDSRLDFGPFIAAIIPHSARWEYLKVELPLDYQHHGLQGLRACSSLRGLSLSGGWWGPDWNPFFEAPQLRAVVLEQFCLNPTPHFIWAQLTTLRVDLIPPSRFMDILHHTVNLVHCRLTILTGVDLTTDAVQINPKRLLLSYLETLVVLVRDESWRDVRPAPTGWFSLTTFPRPS